MTAGASKTGWAAARWAEKACAVLRVMRWANRQVPRVSSAHMHPLTGSMRNVSGSGYIMVTAAPFFLRIKVFDKLCKKN